MKKRFILFTALIIISFGTAFPQLLIENFDYPAGDTLLNHGWAITGTSTTNPITITSPGLNFPGYPLSGLGNAVLLTTTGQDVNKKLSSNVTSGTVYASFMIDVISAQAPGDYFFHLGDFYARTFVRLTSNGNLAFGINKFSLDADAQILYSDSIYSTGTTYLLVVKYTFNPDSINDDVINLFINPAMSSSEPAPDLTVTTWQDDADSIDIISFRQGNASNACSAIIDGMRVASSWTEAVVPVELVSFSTTVLNKSVELKWNTVTEINNRGFEIERKSSSTQWQKIDFVKGNGTTTQSKIYSYTDENLKDGKYTYRLKQLDYNGAFEYSKYVEAEISTIVQYELAQNYPNPFNPSTMINFAIPQEVKVKLEIYNAIGSVVSTLVDETLSAGSYKYTWDASGFPSGIYFYRLQTNHFTSTNKMILLK